MEWISLSIYCTFQALGYNQLIKYFICNKIYIITYGFQFSWRTAAYRADTGGNSWNTKESASA
jgi:hypothetical protein